MTIISPARNLDAFWRTPQPEETPGLEAAKAQLRATLGPDAYNDWRRNLPSAILGGVSHLEAIKSKLEELGVTA